MGSNMLNSRRFNPQVYAVRLVAPLESEDEGWAKTRAVFQKMAFSVPTILNRRGQQSLQENLTRLGQDLDRAKGGLCQMQQQLLEGLLEVQDVAVCYQDLSRHIYDFVDVLQVFQREHGQPPMSATTSATLGNARCWSPGQPASPTVRDSQMAEILQRIERLEGASTQTESQMRTQDDDQSQEILNSKPSKLQGEIGAGPNVMVGQKGGDFPAIYRKLEEMKNGQEFLEERIHGAEVLVNGVSASFRKSLQSALDELMSTKQGVCGHNHAINILEQRTNETVTSLRSAAVKRCQMATQIQELDEGQKRIEDFLRLMSCEMAAPPQMPGPAPPPLMPGPAPPPQMPGAAPPSPLLFALPATIPPGLLPPQGVPPPSYDTLTDDVKFEADVSTKMDHLEEGEPLNHAVELLKNVGGAFRKDGCFVVPKEGQYKFRLELLQDGFGRIKVCLVCDGTKLSGSSVRTTGDFDNGSSNVCVMLKGGQVVSVRVLEVERSPSILKCIFSGRRI